MNCAICDKKLSIRNKIGTCRKHRGLSPVRREYEKSWQKDNMEKYRAGKRQWNRKHPEYFVAYRASDIRKKIAHALRVRIRRVIRQGSAIKNLGCDVSEFITYLENKFTEGMTWENYGKWHIDHIKPLSSFDLTNPDQLAQACNYKNMQPLWAADNIRKNNKIE